MTAPPWLDAVRALVGGRARPGGCCSRPQGAPARRGRGARAGRRRTTCCCSAAATRGSTSGSAGLVVDEEISIGDYVLSRRRAAGDGRRSRRSRARSREWSSCQDRSKRTASAPVCSTIRTTPGRRRSKGWRCPRSCSPETTPRSSGWRLEASLAATSGQAARPARRGRPLLRRRAAGSTADAGRRSGRRNDPSCRNPRRMRRSPFQPYEVGR